MMRAIVAIPVLIAVLFSCRNKQSHSKDVDEGKSYTIAYNILIPDSARGNWEIMHMNSDGSEKKNITNNPDVAWTYHAYKDRLFFISDRDTCYRCYYLYELDRNMGAKKLSDLQLEDSWMSTRNNGEEMIVSGRMDADLRFQLFIINTATGAHRQITGDTAALYRDPCFSPDGKKIVFSYKKNRRDRTTHEELFIMNEDGSELAQLTNYPEDNISAKEFGYRAGAARWHPTENFISYVSKQDGRHSIYAVTPDGKKQWKLIDNPDSEGWHDWSSDGKWIVINNSDNQEKQFHITLMNWETKEKKQLTDTTYKSQLGPVFIEH